MSEENPVQLGKGSTGRPFSASASKESAEARMVAASARLETMKAAAAAKRAAKIPKVPGRKSLKVNELENARADAAAREADSSAPSAQGLVNCAINHRKVSSSPPADAASIAKNDFLQFCYDEAPVVGYRVMKNDVVTVRAARNPEELAERLEGAVRGDIEFLSMKSRRRLALIAGNSEVVFRSFVTVTYPETFPCDGQVVKRHLAALLCALRRKCPGLAYLWFLEFQRRGAPHLHLFLDAALPEPLSLMERKCGRQKKEVWVNWPWQDWLSERWFEIVGSGDAKHLLAGAAWEQIEKPDGAARYVAKESYKTFQKQVPKGFQNVGRFWGTSRGVSPDEGRFVQATPAQMAKDFPSACFDPDANPFPVLFGAAVHVKKPLAETAEDVKLKAWKKTRGQTSLELGSIPIHGRSSRGKRFMHE